MGKLLWTTELSTGIAEIDNQHKRIVAYINQLSELRDSSDRAALANVIGEMVDYTMSHFAFEEELMENAGYTFSGPHKKVHQLFTRKVGEMQSRFDAGEDVATELHSMLSRWLFNHILNEDRGYVGPVKSYLKARAPAVEADRVPATTGKRSWLARLLGT